MNIFNPMTWFQKENNSNLKTIEEDGTDKNKRPRWKGPPRPQSSKKKEQTVVLPLRQRIFIAAFAVISLIPAIFQISEPLNLLMAIMMLVIAVMGLNPPTLTWLRVGMNVSLTVALSALCVSLTLGNPFQAALVAFFIGQLGINRTQYNAQRIFLICLSGAGTAFMFNPSVFLLVFVLAVTLGVSAFNIVIINSKVHPQNRILPATWRLLIRAWIIAIIFSAALITISRPLSWNRFHHFKSQTLTGLTDRLTPGAVENLLSNPQTAFRVKFNGVPPPPNERYWRGPVLDGFDGKTWYVSTPPPSKESVTQSPKVTRSGPVYTYQWRASNSSQRGAFLESIVPSPDVSVDMNYAPVLFHSPTQSITMKAQSINRWSPLPDYLKTHDLFTPTGNPQTEALAKSLWDKNPEPGAYIHQIFQYFHNHIAYTTRPAPLTKNNSVDDFLFNTKEGFCAHIAGAMTILLRDAGIPARMVSGYQGGHWNEFGGYWQIRQSDAHAWVEAWVPDRGGWIRLDPTAVVISIDQDRASANGQGGLWSDFTDWGSEQVGELGDFKAPDINLSIKGLILNTKTTYTILGVCGILMIIFIIQLFLEFNAPKDPLARTLWKLDRRLTRLHLPRKIGESWITVGQRISPFLKEKNRTEWIRVTEGIDRVLYGQKVHPKQLKKVLKAIRHCPIARPKGKKKNA